MLKFEIVQCSLEELNKRDSRVIHYSTLSQYNFYNIVSPLTLIQIFSIDFSLDNNVKKNILERIVCICEKKYILTSLPITIYQHTGKQNFPKLELVTLGIANSKLNYL